MAWRGTDKKKGSWYVGYELLYIILMAEKM